MTGYIVQALIWSAFGFVLGVWVTVTYQRVRRIEQKLMLDDDTYRFRFESWLSRFLPPR